MGEFHMNMRLYTLLFICLCLSMSAVYAADQDLEPIFNELPDQYLPFNVVEHNGLFDLNDFAYDQDGDYLRYKVVAQTRLDIAYCYVDINDQISCIHPEPFRDGTSTVTVAATDLTNTVYQDVDVTFPFPQGNNLNAQCVSWDIPETMAPGETATISVTMRNTGDWGWTDYERDRLGLHDPQDSYLWGYPRIEIGPAYPVQNGEEQTFTFDITAPQEEGTYGANYRMVREFTTWYGETCGQDIQVTSELVVEQVPSPNYLPYNGRIDTEDEGTYSGENDNVFDFDDYVSSSNGQVDIEIVGQSNSDLVECQVDDDNNLDCSVREQVAGESQIDFIATDGVETKSGWFFVNVPFPQENNLNAECVAWEMPETMTPGETATVSVTMKNTGDWGWTAYERDRLGLFVDQDSFIWGYPRENLEDNDWILNGDQKTFTFDITAPQEEGTYGAHYRMVRSYIAWHGETCGQDIQVVHANEAPVFEEIPTQHLPFNVVDHYNVVDLNDFASDADGDELSFSIVSQSDLAIAECAVTSQGVIDCTHPEPFQTGTTKLTVSATDGKETTQTSFDINFPFPQGNNLNAQCVSWDIPETMAPGETATVSVTMKNTGDWGWTNYEQDNLGLYDPQDSFIWGYPRVELGEDDWILNGDQKTFTFDITAPQEEGTYGANYRMVREFTTWYGETCGQDVQVITPLTQLSIEKTGPETVEQDSVAYYTLTVNNLGQEVAQQVIIADKVMDEAFEFIPELSDTACSLGNDGFVFCQADKDVLLPGHPQTFKLAFHVPEDAVCESYVTNQADVHAINGISDWAKFTTQVTCEEPVVETSLECFPHVIINNEQVCSVSVLEDGEPVQTAQASLFFEDGSLFGTCQVDPLSGGCSMSQVQEQVGTFTLTMSINAPGYIQDEPKQFTYEVLNERYEITDLKVFNDAEYTREDYDFFRGEDLYVEFQVFDLVTEEFVAGAVSRATLVSPPGGFIDLTADGNGDTYRFKLLPIPLTHDFLGESQVFTFAFNFVDETGGQEAVGVIIRNNVPELAGEVPDQQIEVGQTISLDLSGFATDLEDATLIWAATDVDAQIIDVHLIGSQLTITGVNPGVDDMTLTVFDLDLDSVSQLVRITVDQAVAQCADGLDNDGDGLPDAQDPGCWRDVADPSTYDPSDDDEADATSQCQDEIDNDGDGLTDFGQDPGCSSPQDNTEFDAKIPECQDGLDNDDDGLVDDQDPACQRGSQSESDDPTADEHMHISRISLGMHPIAAGSYEIDSIVSVRNGGSSSQDTKIQILVPDLGLYGSAGPFKLSVGERETRTINMWSPEPIPAGVYIAKINVYSEGEKRTRYREFVVE